jgi:signal transduction histidine kinase
MRGDTRRVPDETLTTVLALAHELKAPLSVIRQMSLAQEYYDDAARDQAFRRIELISSRSLRLIETLTRSGNLAEFETESINLNRLCEEIAHEFAPLARELNTSIDLSLPKKPIMAVGNRDILRSVVVGLCDNALTHAGAAMPIELCVSRQQDVVQLAVKDCGPVIEKSHLATLKQRLGHAPQALSQRPQSSGLGLYIAGKFAEAMQGKIGMTEHRGGGYSFYITVPHSRQLGLFSL